MAGISGSNASVPFRRNEPVHSWAYAGGSVWGPRLLFGSLPVSSGFRLHRGRLGNRHVLLPKRYLWSGQINNCSLTDFRLPTDIVAVPTPTPSGNKTGNLSRCCEDRGVAQKCTHLCNYNVTIEHLLEYGRECMEHIDHWIDCGVGRTMARLVYARKRKRTSFWIG